MLWENLGCTDGAARQLRGTLYMALLSLAGAFLIGASSYLQSSPKAAEAQVEVATSWTGQLAVVAIGTIVLLVGYLVVCDEPRFPRSPTPSFGDAAAPNPAYMNPPR